MSEITKWHSIKGYQTHRLNYDLNEDSIVFDLGGYIGQYTHDIYEKYGSCVYVFEPSKSFYNQIKSRFSENEKIKVFNYGVSGKTEQLTLINSADSSFVLEQRDNYTGRNVSLQEVEIKSFSDMYYETGVDMIDLMKINIEGGEYDLMKNIFESNLITKVRNFQIQFHNISINSPELVNKIRTELSKTHTLDWKYEWVWENWSLKK